LNEVGEVKHNVKVEGSYGKVRFRPAFPLRVVG
jgi:hypothetical protein